MHLSHELPCRLSRFTFTVLMGIAWAGGVRLNSVRAAEAGKAAGAAETIAQAKDRAERCFRVLQDIERGAPRDTFDVAAVAVSIGKDPDSILKWVGDHIAWVPYHGMLRGPIGVLMDRRGNSLDRATLLAELLRASGKTVRLAHGELSQEAAQQLSKNLSFMPRIPLPAPGVIEPSFVDKLVKDYAAPYGLDPAWLRKDAEELLTRSQRATEDIAGRTDRQTSTLSAMIGGAAEPSGKGVQAAALPTEALEALRDHWWVQVSAGDKSLDLDPDSAPSAPGIPPQLVETIDWQPKDGKWPLDAKLCHEIEIRVVVERWEDGRLSNQTALAQPLRPAELLGQFINVSITPMNWPGDLDLSREPDRAGKVRSLCSQEHEWLPVLRAGQQTYHQGSFKDTGAVNPKPDLDSLGKTGKSVAGAVNSVAGAFGGPPEPPPDHGVLTAAWLEYEIRSPGQPPRQIRRQLFDLLGPAARAGGGAIPQPAIDDKARLERGLNLMGQTEILPLVCQLSNPFVEDLTARNALAMHDPIMKLYSGENEAAVKDAGQSLLALPPLPSRLYDLALTRNALNPHKDEVYFDRPNILSLHQFLRSKDAGGIAFIVGTDIVANEIAVRPDLSPVAAKQARLTQGVLDTSAEALLDDKDVRVPNASDLLASQPAADDWLVVRDRNDPAWQSAQVSKDTRAHVEADLAQGFVAIVPRHSPPGGKMISDWWRVDPRTGDTLGLNEQGWGAEMGEYAFLFMVTFAACLAASGGKEDLSSTKQVAVCAFVGLGIVFLAPEVLTVKIFAGGIATGLGAGGAL